MMLLLLAVPALAGGGPQNVLVVANRKDPDSVRIAEHYVKLRGIPPGNLLRLAPPVALTTDFATYRSRIQEPIKNYLVRTGLVQHIDYVVFTRGLPILTKVPGGNASTTACVTVMDTPLAGQEQKLPVPDNRAMVNPLSRRNPEAFTHAKAFGGYHLYVTTFLTGYTAEDSMALVDRAIAAERARPIAPLFVFQDATGGAAGRNRFYALAIKQLTDAGFAVEHEKTGAGEVTGRKRLMGYMSGGSYSRLTEKGIASNEYPPGAIADMLESYGAVPGNFDPAKKSQVPVTWFVKHGITGIHGAVSEPYAHTFPDALLFQRYAAGMNLGEAFHFSLPFLYWRNLVIGDPLCTPFARRPKVSMAGRPRGTTSGIAKLTITAEGPVKTIRLFVDGLLAGETAGKTAAVFPLDTTRLADGPHHVLAAAILTGPLAIQGWTTATVEVKHPGVLALTARRGPSGSVLVTTTRKVPPGSVTATIGGAAATRIERWDETATLKIVPAKPLPAGRVVIVELSGAAKGRVDYAVPPVRFEVTAPETAKAGEPITIKVRALDDAGGTAQAYRGRVTVAIDDPPIDAATLSADRPEFSVAIRLVRAGNGKIHVYDRLTSTEGTARVTVRPGDPAAFTAHPGTCPQGEPFDLTVTLKDAFGNVATQYEGELNIRFPGDLRASPPEPAVATAGRAVFRDVLLHKTGRHLAVVADRSGRDVGRGLVHVTTFTLRTWLVLGPVKADAIRAITDAKPSEGHLAGGHLWRAYRSPKNEVDLRRALGSRSGVAFAHLYVFVPKEVKARLNLGWGAKLVLFVDGREVFAGKKEEPKVLAERQKIRGVGLAEGWHRILIRTEHGGKSDRFVFRVSENDGSPIEGMKTSLSDPEATGLIEGKIPGVPGMEVALTGPATIVTRTLEDGTFRVGGVAAGTWTVAPRAKGLVATPGSRQVEVGTGAVTGLTFTVSDEVAPTVSIEQPADGVKTGASVTVKIVAEDNVAVTEVVLRVDGARIGKPLTQAPWMVALAAKDVGYRPVRLTAVATDAAGNTTESAPVRVRFFRDRKGPTLRITSPGSGRTITEKMNLVAAVEDDSGVLSVEFLIDGRRIGRVLTKAPFEIPFDPKSVPKGVHTLTVVTKDELGNETKKSVRFKTR